jgi:hypothetical protein
MTVSHIFSSPLAEDTGTVTVFNSQGLSVTQVASSLVGPNEWNSAHNATTTLTGNTLGASTVSGSNIILSATGQLSLSGNASTIVFTAPSNSTISGLNINYPWALTSSNLGNSSVRFAPFTAEYPLTITQMNIPVSFLLTSTSSTQTAGLTWAGGVYSQTGTTFSSMATGTVALSMSSSSSTASFTLTGMGSSTSFSTGGGVNLGAAIKYINIPMSTLIPAGIPCLAIYSGTGAGAGLAGSFLANTTAGPAGAVNVQSGVSNFTETTAYDRVLGGVFTATTAALPASFGSTMGSGVGSWGIPYIELVGS